MRSPDPPAERLWTRAFVALALADLAYFTAAGILILITPLFAKDALGADPVGVGLAVGAFSVTALVLRPWTGRMADLRGRRPMLIAGASLCAASIAAHALSDSLAILVALRLLLGVAEALFFVAGFAMLADLAPPNRAGEALSYNSLALYLGLAIGPSIAEILFERGSYGLVWVGATALAIAATALAFLLPETRSRDTSDEAAPFVLVHRGVLGPSLALFSGITAMAGFLAFVAIYGRDVLGLDGAGPVLMAYGLTVVGLRIAFAKLPDRVPPYPLAAGALALIAVGMFLAGTLTTEAGLLLGSVVMAIGVAFVTPAVFRIVTMRTSPADRGVALGTVSLFLDLAFGGGPVLIGFVADAAGIPMGFLLGSAVAASGAVGVAAAALPRRAPATQQ